MRSPVIISKMERIRSRSRRLKRKIVEAPSSMPNEPTDIRCDVILLSSIIMTRMMEARSGMASSMPSRRSTPRQYVVSLKSGDR
jgi:hypothetical protein